MNEYYQKYGNEAVAEAQNAESTANAQTSEATSLEQKEKNAFWSKAAPILTGLDVLTDNVENIKTAGGYLLKAFKNSGTGRSGGSKSGGK